MRSEEAQIGKQVRVRADHRSLTLRGLVGTIEKRWGAPHTSASTCCSTTALSSCSGTTSWRRSPPLRLGGACCSVVALRVNSGSYSAECVENRYSRKFTLANGPSGAAPTP